VAWMHVDQNEINQPLDARDPTASGVSLRVYVSPYDIPVAIQGIYDDVISRFVISLKYAGLDEERKIKTRANDLIDFYVGKESNRMYRIAVDVEAMGAERIECEVLSAIDKLNPTRTRRGNYIAAKRAIQQSRGRLEALAAAR
jgi:hypothetical protein